MIHNLKGSDSCESKELWVVLSVFSFFLEFSVTHLQFLVLQLYITQSIPYKQTPSVALWFSLLLSLYKVINTGLNVIFIIIIYSKDHHHCILKHWRINAQMLSSKYPRAYIDWRHPLCWFTSLLRLSAKCYCLAQKMISKLINKTENWWLWRKRIGR